MKNLFLGSVTERSGKSMIALGLAKNGRGKVGYFKPFREVMMCHEGRPLDQDARLMKRALGLPWSEEELSPFAYDAQRPVALEEIVASYERLSEGMDRMLIEGTRDIFTGCLGDVSGMTIAHALGAPTVLVSSATVPALDKICMLCRMMEHHSLEFRGVILNNSDDPVPGRLLERKGVKVLGEVPTVPQLRHYTVREVAEAVEASVVQGEGQLDGRVENVMIGAMSPEAALTHMKRVSRKALITGGDRADIQMAALSTDTSCIVLTGGMPPSRSVMVRAYETGVPILLTDLNTLEASDRIDHLVARIDPDDEGKVELIATTVREHVDIEAIWGD
ncbi:MAG: phosphotransacetylase family protein [Methanomassiliicoccaceae archaeon]|jgi:BioD-like phosphotransacetylase family protein|nr:phosphotransacetylase family protein [Euryarchaeota archaeon]HOB38882.1 DRTGG domain-containing protein [Methanomassiliicoccaceae archaeon]HOQ25305.1 DRTGG domain-containing protein [Methanomassiliicoccaceae archaeon]HQA21227.1 DRTGG domain-containing protein [Methanomassiliicoccaceae archaeon]HQD88754.1 DRTGG domain-containing protein [Methanomassiliicoccaceae archaeon]